MNTEEYKFDNLTIRQFDNEIQIQLIIKIRSSLWDLCFLFLEFTTKGSFLWNLNAIDDGQLTMDNGIQIQLIVDNEYK